MMTKDQLKEAVNKIDWTKLEHAYGSAEKIPAVLANIIDKKEKEALEALNNLLNNIIHGGGIYSATVEAIPFLVKIVELRTDAPKLQAEILAVLGDILTRGRTPVEAHYHKDEIDGSEELKLIYEKEIKYVEAARQTIKRFTDDIERIFQNKDTDEKVRIEALYYLELNLEKKDLKKIIKNMDRRNLGKNLDIIAYDFFLIYDYDDNKEEINECAREDKGIKGLIAAIAIANHEKAESPGFIGNVILEFLNKYENVSQFNNAFRENILFGMAKKICISALNLNNDDYAKKLSMKLLEMCDAELDLLKKEGLDKWSRTKFTTKEGKEIKFLDGGKFGELLDIAQYVAALVFMKYKKKFPPVSNLTEIEKKTLLLLSKLAWPAKGYSAQNFPGFHNDFGIKKPEDVPRILGEDIW